jgi:hypothetical protein
MRGMARVLAAYAFIAAGAPTLAQEPLKQCDTISGRLRLVKTRHPNGTPISAYQIVVDVPKDFAEKDEFCDGAPKTFHLVVMNDKAKAQRLNAKWARKSRWSARSSSVRKPHGA